MKQLTEKEEHVRKRQQLFQHCAFLLNRETPIYSLQYLISSFGGVFVTEDDEAGLKITHHVMDRPVPGKLQTNREHVVPQWIVDSLNNLYLLPTGPYKPGQAPPPHLSPFVDNTKEGYVPQRLKEIQALKGEAVEELEEEEESEQEEAEEREKTELKQTI